MDELLILNELQKNYGLRDNELAILTLLIKSSKKLTAHEISKQTKIPMGRIYDFLNELLLKKLVEKNEGTPARYFISNLEQNVSNFLNFQFESENKRVLAITAALDKLYASSSAGIRILYGKEEFILEMIKHTQASKCSKMMLLGLAVPYLFYPEDKNEFLKMRRLVTGRRGSSLTGESPALQALLNDAIHRRCREGKEYKWIISEKTIKIFVESLEKNYGKKYVLDYLSGLKNKIKHNIQVRTTNEDFPYSMSIFDDCIMFAARADGEMVSLVFNSQEGVQFFSKFFDATLKECKDAKEIFDDYSKR